MSDTLQMEMARFGTELSSWACRKMGEAEVNNDEFQRFMLKIDIFGRDITLAAKARDIIMRRGWVAFRLGDQFKVDATNVGSGGYGKPNIPEQATFWMWLRAKTWPCPFAALVEAEELYVRCTDNPEESRKEFDMWLECQK